LACFEVFQKHFCLRDGKDSIQFQLGKFFEKKSFFFFSNQLLVGFSPCDSDCYFFKAGAKVIGFFNCKTVFKNF